jgi:DNA-binding MarR family transcriptional regulator
MEGQAKTDLSQIRTAMDETKVSEKNWSFLTPHALVLMALARDPFLRVRDLAVQVNVTQRAIHRFIRILCEVGYLEKSLVGKRSRYRINPSNTVRHPDGVHFSISAMLQILSELEPPV